MHWHKISKDRLRAIYTMFVDNFQEQLFPLTVKLNSKIY
jgi:hypothetical protein